MTPAWTWLPPVPPARSLNQGQVCTAGSRLYVQRKRFDQVLERLAAIAGDLSIGPGLDPTTQINPLVSARQQERVLGMIESGG